MLKEVKLYNGTILLKFDDEKHKYWNEKGVPLISTTGATKVLDKPALLGWVAKEMGIFMQQNWDVNRQYTEEEKIELIDKAKKEYRWVSKKATDIGTAIHELVEKWIKGEKFDMPTDENVLNGLTAFLKYQKEHKSKWLLSERLVYSRKHQVSGTMDGLELIESEKKLYPTDFKSSKGIYDEMNFQIGGYQMMLEEEIKYLLTLPFSKIKDPKDKILVKAYKKYGGFKQRKIIRFGKFDGEFEVKTLDNYEMDRDAFIACLAIGKRIKALKKEWRENNKKK